MAYRTRVVRPSGSSELPALQAVLRIHHELAGFRFLLVGSLVAFVVADAVFLLIHPLALVDPANSALVAEASGALLGAVVAGLAFAVVLFLGRTHAVARLAASGLPYPELGLAVAFFVSDERLIRLLRAKGPRSALATTGPPGPLDLGSAARAATVLRHRTLVSLLPFVVQLVVVGPVVWALAASSPSDVFWVVLASWTVVAGFEVALWSAWRRTDARAREPA